MRWRSGGTAAGRARIMQADQSVTDNEEGTLALMQQLTDQWIVIVALAKVHTGEAEE